MKYLYPLNAIHVDGHTILLYTQDDVDKFVREYGVWYDIHTEHYYDWSAPLGYRQRCRINNWIVRDDRGRKVKFEDVQRPRDTRRHWLEAQRVAAAKGLPIPGTGGYRKCWKMNHTAKKNSGAGHRNRNRALFVEHFKEYGIRNNNSKPIPWENC